MRALVVRSAVAAPPPRVSLCCLEDCRLRRHSEGLSGPRRSARSPEEGGRSRPSQWDAGREAGDALPLEVMSWLCRWGLSFGEAVSQVVRSGREGLVPERTPNLSASAARTSPERVGICSGSDFRDRRRDRRRDPGLPGAPSGGFSWRIRVGWTPRRPGGDLQWGPAPRDSRADSSHPLRPPLH